MLLLRNKALAAITVVLTGVYCALPGSAFTPAPSTSRYLLKSSSPSLRRRRAVSAIMAGSGPFEYDLLILGGGPTGVEAVKTCAMNRLDQRICVVEPKGAMCPAPTGAVSKIYRQCAIDEGCFVFEEFQDRLNESLERVSQLKARFSAKYDNEVPEGVTVLAGGARFVDEHTVEVVGEEEGSELKQVTANKILIATGSKATRFSWIPFGPGIYDSDTIAGLTQCPEKIVILGASVIGCEFAQIFREFGSEVVVVDVVDSVMAMCDEEVSREMQRRMEDTGISIKLNSSVKFDEEDPFRVKVYPMGVEEDGAWVKFDAFLAATGRRGNTETLNLDRIGLSVDRTGCVPVHPTSMWTGKGNIYAAGDVAGPNEIKPSGLVTTGQAQAIRAVFSMYVNEWPEYSFRADYYPDTVSAIWTNPDVAYIGPTEEEARQRYGDAAIGVATATFDCCVKYAVTPREGFLKLVFLLDGGQILACHLLGDDANEFVHYGAAMVNGKHTVTDIVRQVMAGVTYNQVYRAAAIDAVNQVQDYMESKL